MKPAHVLALVIIAISLGFTLMSFGGAMAKHVTVPEAIAREGTTVQVPGKILKDTVTYTATGGHGQLRFDIVDMKDGESRMTVIYRQPKPENFDSATSVEAIGRFRDGEFHADNLLVKCPSKYNDEAQ